MLECVGCGATAQELAGGQALQGMTKEVVLNAAGLHRRSGGDLLCEDCWRLLMRQP